MQLNLFQDSVNQIEDGDSKTCNKCHRLLPLTAFSMHSASNYQRPTNPQVSSVNAGIPTYGTTVNSQIKTSAGAIPQYNGGN